MIKESDPMGGISSLNESVFSLRNGKMALAAACLLGGLSLASEPAQAARNVDRAPSQTKAKVTALASQDPETTGSIGEDRAGDLNCARSRKRLWVEGEGWIVRKVTTCY
jgi:hypothetical protein